MKQFQKIFIISLLLLLLMYTANITSIPEKIVVFQGEHYNVKTLFGISITPNNENYEVIQTSSNLTSISQKTEKLNFTLNLFGAIPLKNINVNVIPKTYVVPLGNTVGLKLYTSRSTSSWNGRNRRK
ncbi:MAG: hypothetical protein J6A04_02560 [Clostridia bacterium]|nr:hypothetical protein [Clostridia bacterium]